MTQLNKILKIVGGALIISAQFLALGFFLLFLHYDATRPTTMRLLEGRVYPWSDHGHVVYLAPSEQLRLYALSGISGSLIAIGAIMVSVTERRQKGTNS